MSEDTADVHIKVCVIGESGVGKSCIVQRLVKKDFDESSKTTVGVEYMPYRVKLESQIVQMELWDTAVSFIF